MSPNQREREYEKRRYEKWQNQIALKRERRSALIRTGLVLLVVLAIGLGAGYAAFSYLSGRNSSTEDSATRQAREAIAAKNPCPKPKGEAGDPPKVGKPAASAAQNRTWEITFKTSCGVVKAELDGATAPQATAVMTALAKGGFYNGTPCHRLVASGIYVLQCGSPQGDPSGGPDWRFGPIENAPIDDAYPGGTIAMARVGNDGNSMGSQFFIAYADTTIPSDDAGGYTVVGQVTEGMEIIRKVADGGVEDGKNDGLPARAISIESATVTPVQ